MNQFPNPSTSVTVAPASSEQAGRVLGDFCQTTDERESERLQQLAKFGIMYSDHEIGFDRIVRLVKAYVDVPVVGISFIDKDSQFIKASVGMQIPTMPRVMSICNYTITSTEPFIVPDTHQHAELKHHPLVLNPPFVRFYAGFPIIVKNEQDEPFVLGALCLVDSQPRAMLTDEQINVLQDFALMVSDALQLRHQQQQAKRADDVKTAFLANISHEIRTPMSGILGMLELLNQTELSPQQLNYVNYIKDGNDYLLAIVNDIWDLSRAEQGDIRFKAMPTDLKAVCQQLIAGFYSQAVKQGVHLSLVYACDVPNSLLVDAKRVRQILSKLISNAIHFTPKGGEVTLRVVRDTHPDGDQLLLQVKDTGRGISADTQAVIFDAYEQADKFAHRLYGGVGLGLSVCKAFAKGMGGQMQVSSEVGNGAMFSLRLPMQTIAQATFAPVNPATVENVAPLAPPDIDLNLNCPAIDTPVQHEVSLESETSVEKQATAEKSIDTPKSDTLALTDRLPAHILLVEDNELNAMVALKTLKKYGYTADRAKDGQEAVNIFSESPDKYQMILMDHQMPIMDGVEATKILTERFRQQLPPVIAVTAHATHGDKSIYFNVGMKDCLPKPYKPEMLDNVIQKWLQPTPAPLSA